jgi:hypothetical protein
MLNFQKKIRGHVANFQLTFSVIKIIKEHVRRLEYALSVNVFGISIDEY